MKKIVLPDHHGEYISDVNAQQARESNWCARYGYFIDLAACEARSLSRPVCRRCYKTLIQLSLPF